VTVDDDSEEMARKELDCDNSSCVLQLQWDLYNYCAEIRCQDTTSEDEDTSVCEMVNCKV
jgi:hypothetical protein